MSSESTPIAAGLVVGLVFFALGALFVVISRQMQLGTLKPNAWVGIRIPATMGSSDSWYRGHQAASPSIRALGVITTLLGLAIMVVGLLSAPQYLFVIATLVVVVVVLAGVIRASIIAARGTK